jgi:hypothetical protein
MITIHPNPSPSWDRISESTVQHALYRMADPSVRREQLCANCRVDFQSDRRLIEVKRTSSGQQVHATLGQVIYYRDVWYMQAGQYLKPTILIYGSDISRYTCPVFSRLRVLHGIDLWLLVSLRKGAIIDLDNGKPINIKEW